MHTSKKTILEIVEIIKSVEGVEDATAWEREQHARVYITLPKLNGGPRWNAGRAVTAYYDCAASRIVCKGDWAGAKTRDYGTKVLKAIETALAA